MKGSGSIAGLLPVICLMVGLAGYPVQLRAVTLDQIIDLITEAHGPVNHERRVKLFSDALTSLQVWEKTHRGRGHQRARCAVYGMLAFTEDPALESVAYTIYSMLREEPVCGDVLWNERRMLDVLEERLSGNAGVVETGGRFEERGIRTVSYEHTKGRYSAADRRRP